ncbi:autoinducer binding domain-containing protein [Pelagibacterium lentulum]|uniref:HTH cro/C1-type domain-containing protein n=1 Tax=Pelagibacterium lentulum TaxID=2029865 RepID=A0A916W0Z3_9HYPH|nr:autoinducer binding domain-containing protein [Pelagibacterium lentulum]GGA57372.1 hypothetical protein GCM10011499_29540 [Pelagibacterium lentulum]
MNSQFETFGKKLAKHRHRRALSQLALSLDAGVSTRHISFLETGRSTPTREMIHRLAEVLGLAPSERIAMMNAAGYWEMPATVPGSDPCSNCHTNDDLDVVISIESVNCAEDAFDVAATALARIGLTQFFTGTVENADAGQLFQICHHQLTRAPLGWMLHYADRNYVAIDPLVRETRARHLPFFWSDLFQTGTLLHPTVRRMLDEARDFRITNGFVMPIHRADGKVHALSSMTQCVDVADPAVRATARTISVALLHKIDALGLPQAGVDLKLSEKDRDFLSYLFEGRSIDWIADQYQTDRGEVTRSVSVICAKFGTSDPLETALRARRMGLLAAS